MHTRIDRIDVETATDGSPYPTPQEWRAGRPPRPYRDLLSIAEEPMTAMTEFIVAGVGRVAVPSDHIAREYEREDPYSPFAEVFSPDAVRAIEVGTGREFCAHAIDDPEGEEGWYFVRAE